MTKQPTRKKRTQEKAQVADITSETHPCSYNQEYHKNTKLEAYIYIYMQRKCMIKIYKYILIRILNQTLKLQNEN